MDAIQIGMIGCGSMGMSLARKLAACDPRLRVTAVFDPDPRSVDKARQEWGEALEVCSSDLELIRRRDIK